MLPQLRGTPVVALSGETGKGVEKLMPAVLKSHKDWSTKVKTRDLNDWLQMAMQRHPPPSVGGKRIKPKYMAQTKARPPTFVLFSSRADQMPEQYRRYLINSLRESFDLPGVPLRITLKSGANPYAEGEAKGHSGKGKREFERKEREKSGSAPRATPSRSRCAWPMKPPPRPRRRPPACPRRPQRRRQAVKAEDHQPAPRRPSRPRSPRRLQGRRRPGKARSSRSRSRAPRLTEEVGHAQLQGRLQGRGGGKAAADSKYRAVRPGRQMGERRPERRRHHGPRPAGPH
jgi:hypothetical protein